MKRFLVHLYLFALIAPSAFLMVAGVTWLRLVQIMPKPTKTVDSYPWFEALIRWLDDYTNS